MPKHWNDMNVEEKLDYLYRWCELHQQGGNRLAATVQLIQERLKAVEKVHQEAV
jgi:hypothetical protein